MAKMYRIVADELEFRGYKKLVGEASKRFKNTQLK